MAPEQPERQSQTRGWTRVLAPLAWWLLLVLVLYGIQTHQRLMQQTYLNCTVNLEHRPAADATVTVDRRPIVEGEHLSLGSHEFKVTHPKAVPFVTNRFVWYRGGRLGIIDLKRATGVLAVTVDPPASVTVVDGPEYHKSLSDSPAGLTNTVPTDDYEVKATYAHFEKTYRVKVAFGETNRLGIAPKLGSLALTCTQNDATFQLFDSGGELVEKGDFPTTLNGLPEGSYQLVALHHSRRWVEKPVVTDRATNDVKIDIQYGSAVFETSPAGATVYSNGREIGTTPLNLSELQPGWLEYEVRLYNYESVSGSLQIKPNEIAKVKTNLVSQSYSGAMRSAREYTRSGKYDSALASVADALRVQPEDADAKKLEKEITALSKIREAEGSAQKGDYIGGARLLKTALEILPDNERAKSLLADYRAHEPEQLQREALVRLNRGTNVFNNIIGAYSDRGLFETHFLTTTNHSFKLEPEIISALRTEPLGFKIEKRSTPAPETYAIRAVHEFGSVVKQSGDRRELVMVIAQTRKDETQIFYEIFEYHAATQIGQLNLGNLLGAPVQVKLVPIHATAGKPLSEKLQARINEGITNVVAKINSAITKAASGLR